MSKEKLEFTSKKYKIQFLLSTLLIIGGLFLMIPGYIDNRPSLLFSGEVSFSIGIIWKIAVRCHQVWWNHD